MPVEGVALPSEVAASIETDFSADFNMARRIQKTMRQKLKKPSKKHHPFKVMFMKMQTWRLKESMRKQFLMAPCKSTRLTGK